jgi:UDP-glucose 4-epimerase
MKILATGGAGFIGSHTVLLLLEAGHDVVVLDNLSNANAISMERVAELAGSQPTLIVGDVTDPEDLARLFSEHDFDSVVHFAGLKSVGESVSLPLEYFRVNVGGTLHLLSAMADAEVFNIVFSSSATVYGNPEVIPVTESSPTEALNPYGRTKLIIEHILRDIAAADNRWSVALLRYFNPIGAHSSGRIGEDPTDIPNNLMPYVTQVAARRLPYLKVFGDDYETPDGTGVRDYIHVMDLARGHLAALGRISNERGVHTWNLGTGAGTSVLELVNAFMSSTGQEVPLEVTSRRPGDPASIWADATKAREELGWESALSLEDACRDAWAWQSANPDGFPTG